MSTNAKVLTVIFSLLGASAFAVTPALATGQTHPAVPPQHAASPAASHPHAAAQTHATAAHDYGWSNDQVYSQRTSKTYVRFEEESFYDSYIKGKLHIGASVTLSSPKETIAPNGTHYLGNLNKMKEEEMTGIGFNIQYDICDYVALSFANDMHFELSAWNQPTIEHPATSTDGDLIIDGMLFQVILQYPFRFHDNSWALTPYVGFGVTEISTKWSHAAWWHYGWANPADYDLYGNGSTTPRKGNSRWMVPEDPSSAFTFTAGLSLQILAHLDLDFFYRMVSVDDVDAKFHRRSPNGPTERVGYFPAEFSSLGLALRYVF